MSRYEEKFDSGILVVCGWDPPLQCYFAHLRDEAVHEDANPVIWVGTGLGGDPHTFDELTFDFREELIEQGYIEDSRILKFIHHREQELVADKEANR